MKVYFKITSKDRKARGQTIGGEITLKGEGADPTLPMVLNSTITKVADEHPWLHGLNDLTVRVAFKEGDLG